MSDVNDRYIIAQMLVEDEKLVLIDSRQNVKGDIGDE